MRAGLGVNGDDIGAGRGKVLDVWIGGRDHQMHIEGFGGMGAQGADHRRPNGDIGHEMPIHHIHVDIIGARPVDQTNFLAQLGEVCR